MSEGPLISPGPPHLPELDSQWSRQVNLSDGTRVHLLDTHSPDRVASGEADLATVEHVLVCVHGNPTWSYLWRRVLAQAPPGWRVLAPDHVGMGYSQRVPGIRRLEQRITDLDEVMQAVGVLDQGSAVGPGEPGTTPVSLMVHDWGGAIGLGWAARRPGLVARVVLTNTALWQPDQRVPAAIRAVRSTQLHRVATVSTPAFVRGAAWVGRPGPTADVARAFSAPYPDAASRQAVGDFVTDIPLEPGHPSRAALAAAAEGARALHVPALVIWGAKDPVFTDRYLKDVLERFPEADIHRYADASHLVLEDRPQAVELAWEWLTEQGAGGEPPEQTTPTLPSNQLIGQSVEHSEVPTPRPPGAPEHTDVIWSRLREQATGTARTQLAMVEFEGSKRTSLTFGELWDRIQALAAGLRARGVGVGSRVAVLIPPGRELTVAVYAVWQAGGAIVVADAGLGLRPMASALRSADPDVVLGIPAGLIAARILGVGGERLVSLSDAGSATDPTACVALRAAGAASTLQEVERVGAREARVPEHLPSPDDEAAVLFTSGATGPPKGVVYRHRQLLAQREVIGTVLGVGPGDALVAAFAPFALYGPALGVTSVVPDMNVTKPDTLTALALARAIEAIQATVVFASPAALRNVVATADARTLEPFGRTLTGVRTLLSAGAPVPVELLEAIRTVLPEAATHTPYGMTEALPLTDIDPRSLEPTALARHAGVCVGLPVPGVTLAVAPLDEAGTPGADSSLTTDAGVTGEIVARGPHVKSHYDRLWGTQRATAHPPGWHRTGDVGHFDEVGRLWVEGRQIHVVTTESGPVAPGGIEARVERLATVRQAAVVGVGPAGGQSVVVVLVTEEPGHQLHRHSPVADLKLSDHVRQVALDGPGAAPVAAVLVRERLPVDIRHASKIDRVSVARWAEKILAGDAATGVRGHRRGVGARLGNIPAATDRVGFR